MRSLETSPSSSFTYSSCEDEELAPTQLLSLAIKKRRALYESKDRDFRRELLHTGMIQSLCKFLGEGRALRRRSRRKRRSSSSQKPTNNYCNDARKDLPLKYMLSNEQLEKSSDVPVTEQVRPSVANVSDDGDDDAVVPVVKRAKFEPNTEEETVQSYGFDEFLSSLVTFYTPDCCPTTTVEPTKG